MKPRTRRILNTVALAAGVAAVFGIASVVSRRVFERPHERASSLPALGRSELTAAAEKERALFRVAAIEGSVETLHDGQWYLVQAGDFLSLDDVVRTPRGTRAILRRGGSEILLRENVDIRLKRLADATARFDLLRGGSVATAVSGPETVEIGASESSTVNQGPARWIVSQTPLGTVQVATAEGEVRFSAKGKDVLVREGHESHADPGQPPTPPEEIPDELLLSVFWPERDKQEGSTDVRGKTRVSTRVRVNGKPIDVKPDGSFATPVPLGMGDNQISVEAEDILGRRKTISNTIRREPRAPVLEPEKEELWKK
jgi:hypothetical protein